MAANARIASLHPHEYELVSDMLDWNLVTHSYVRTRSAAECKIQWSNVMHPDINHDEWTKDEEAQLVELANKNELHQWVEVAKELGVRQTAAQMRTYAAHSNALMIIPLLVVTVSCRATARRCSA